MTEAGTDRATEEMTVETTPLRRKESLWLTGIEWQSKRNYETVVVRETECHVWVSKIMSQE